MLPEPDANGCYQLDGWVICPPGDWSDNPEAGGRGPGKWWAWDEEWCGLSWNDKRRYHDTAEQAAAWALSQSGGERWGQSGDGETLTRT